MKIRDVWISRSSTRREFLGEGGRALLNRNCDLAVSTYAAKHALVGHNAYCEKVNASCVVLAAHHFRCHVAWRAWRVLRVLLSPDAGDTEVSDADVPWIRNQLQSIFCINRLISIRQRPSNCLLVSLHCSLALSYTYRQSPQPNSPAWCPCELCSFRGSTRGLKPDMRQKSLQKT